MREKASLLGSLSRADSQKSVENSDDLVFGELLTNEYCDRNDKDYCETTKKDVKEYKSGFYGKGTNTKSGNKVVIDKKELYGNQTGLEYDYESGHKETVPDDEWIFDKLFIDDEDYASKRKIENKSPIVETANTKPKTDNSTDNSGYYDDDYANKRKDWDMFTTYDGQKQFDEENSDEQDLSSDVVYNAKSVYINKEETVPSSDNEVIVTNIKVSGDGSKTKYNDRYYYGRFTANRSANDVVDYTSNSSSKNKNKTTNLSSFDIDYANIQYKPVLKNKLWNDFNKAVLGNNKNEPNGKQKSSNVAAYSFNRPYEEIENRLDRIQRILKYRFNNLFLLRQALTTSERANEIGQSGWEPFVRTGESVWQYYTNKAIHKNLGLFLSDIEPNCQTNEYLPYHHIYGKNINDFYNAIFCDKSLKSRIDVLHLAQHFDLSSREKQLLAMIDINHDSDIKVKASMFKSLIGAVAVDCDFDQNILDKKIQRLFGLDVYLYDKHIEDVNIGHYDMVDAKNILFDLAKKGYCSYPEFTYTNKIIPNRGVKGWECVSIVRSLGLEYVGYGYSKDDAATRASLLILQNIFGNPYGDVNIEKSLTPEERAIRAAKRKRMNKIYYGKK